MNPLPGVGGTLLPHQFIIDGRDDMFVASATADLEPLRRRFCRWWDQVEATCGPATGIRAIFDVVAMPLAGMLGFRARTAEFDRARGTARLETNRGTTISLIVLPWASRPSSVWRDLTVIARSVAAHWTMVVAPPFVSVVPSRGFGIRRSVDFRLADVLDARSFPCFLAICRATAFDPALTNDRSPIDHLVLRAAGFQDRVRADLQTGVVDALGVLGRTLDRRAGVATPETRFNEALIVVYRMLFLLFAESRDLVPRAHRAYGPAYSIASLCKLASNGRSQTGLWEGLAAITRLSRIGCRTDDLIVRPFNGHLFARAAAPSLETSRPARLPTRISNTRDAAMARALVSLSTRRTNSGRQEIGYADLGVEQLGAVYERVLDLIPETVLDAPAGGTAPAEGTGRARHSRRRKETGTFYTPQSLAEFVVRRTLAPLVADASSEQILALRVVDPAMGSGAFLVAACRYLAAAYERALIDDGSAAATDFDDDRHASIRRLIAERCLAGVDANPLAVQLARLSLWLATLARGKPLSFLDHRLRVGDSLVGSSPDALPRLAPRRGNRSPEDSRLPLFDSDELESALQRISRPLAELNRRPDETVRDVREKEAIWRRISGNQSPLEPWRIACNLWCARWFWPGRQPPSPAELRAAFDALIKRDPTIGGGHLSALIDTARSVAARHGFFHWPLEFADVFYDEAGQPRETPGFDAVIGNPPWEMLRNDGPDPRNDAAGVGRFVRESGLYPSCGRGHLNLYQPFLERALSLANRAGRIGLILPWGLAADDGAKGLRETLLDRARLHTVIGVDNAHAIFPVHRGLRFMAIVACPEGPTGEIRARFGVRTVEEIDNLPAHDDSIDGTPYPVRLSRQTLIDIGGPARRIPDLRSSADLALLRRLMSLFPPVGGRNGWSAEFGRELNATDDRATFGATGLPVIEGKHIAPFAAAIDAPAHRIERRRAREKLPGESFARARLAYRDVSSVTNRLSLIAAIVPPNVVTTHTLLCLRTPMPLVRQHFLCGLFNSYVLNALVRMLMGGHVTTSLVESLPIPVWTGDPMQRRIAVLARRLSWRPHDETSHAELQAAIASLYAFDSQTFHSLLETFPLIAPTRS